MRDINDPRVALILKAIDRAAASPHRSCLRLSASAIATRHDIGERFDGWDPDEIRPFVLALALHAPDFELAGMVESAESEIAWVEYYDTEGHIEDVDCRECGAKHVQVTS